MSATRPGPPSPPPPGPPSPPKGRGLLQGRTVLVTAAAGTGIGYAVAERCLAEGAAVMLSDRHERRLEEAARALGGPSGPLPHRACDVTSQEQVEALAAAAQAEFGPLDVLVNNAGLGGYAKVAEMTDEEWSRVLDVTLTGTFRMTRAVLPGMLARGAGAIVNNASVLGWRAQEGQAHYAAAKAGVMAFTRCVAMEAAPAGVRCNAVSPSLATHENLTRVMPPGLLEDLTAREALGRGAEPFEVANVIVFLASEYASYLTGECISVSSQHP